MFFFQKSKYLVDSRNNGKIISMALASTAALSCIETSSSALSEEKGRGKACKNFDVFNSSELFQTFNDMLFVKLFLNI